MAKNTRDKNSERSAAVWNKYRELLSDSGDRLREIEKSEKWFAGDEGVQWAADRPKFQPRTMANLLESNVRTKVALLTDSKPKWYIYGIPEIDMLDAIEAIQKWKDAAPGTPGMPAGLPGQPQMPGQPQAPEVPGMEKIQALTDLTENMNVALDYIWRYNRMHMMLEQIVLLGGITGLLAARVYWDKEANERGEMKIEPMNSKYLFFDKTVNRVDVEDGTCGWFVSAIPKPLTWFERYFPGAKVKPIKEAQEDEGTSVQKGMYIEAYSYNLEYDEWTEGGVKQRKLKYPRAVQFTQLGGKEVLWDGAAPFFNYVCTPYETKLGDYYGEGDVKKQILLNQDFNSKLAQVSLNIALSSNRQYVINPAKLGMKIEQLLEHANEPGWVFQTIKLAEDVKNAIIALDSPVFAPELFNYLFYIPQLMEQVTGIMKSLSGEPQKKERQTKYEIGKQYEAATVRIRNTAHHVEAFLTDLVYVIVKGIKVYYGDKPRKIYSVDETTGKRQTSNFQFPKEANDYDFIVTVQPESMLPIDAQSQAERDMQLFQMNAIDPQTLLETLKHPKAAQIMQRLQEMAAMQQQGQQPQGNTGPPIPQRPS